MNRTIFIIAITIITIGGCSQTPGEKEDKFTWTIQMAGYDFDQFDEKGETDYNNFITEFESFPWLDQLDAYLEKMEGCSPTLSVKDLQTGRVLWVSMMGTPEMNTHLLGYIYPKKEKELLGLTTKSATWLEAYIADTSNVKQCYKMIFDRNYEQLESTIRALEEYGQGEVKSKS